MPVSLAKLKKGKRFRTASLDLSPSWIRDYCDAVEDEASMALEGLVSPMAVATLSMRALLQLVELPGGTIHVGQQLAWEGIRTGQPRLGPAMITSRGERSGWVLMTINHEVVDTHYEQLMVGNATVAFPISAASRRPDDVAPESVGSAMEPTPTRKPAPIRLR